MLCSKTFKRNSLKKMAVLKRTEMHNVSLISNGDNARVQRAKLQATWLEHKMQTYNKYLDM